MKKTRELAPDPPTVGTVLLVSSPVAWGRGEGGRGEKRGGWGQWARPGSQGAVQALVCVCVCVWRGGRGEVPGASPVGSRGRRQDGQRDKQTSDAGPTGGLREPWGAVELGRNVLGMVTAPLAGGSQQQWP